ncbi:MAG: SPOR domain-containing protein [Candidatus Eisenbacteria bacterium]
MGKDEFEDVAPSSGERRDHVSGSSCYRSASSASNELKIPLLGDLIVSEEIGAWERDFSLLSKHGWVSGSNEVVKRLVQLREISPLDIVAVCGMTTRLSIRPFVCSLAVALRKLVQRVVLMDCDLRSPSLQTVTKSDGKEGFIDMVKYGCSFFAAADETEIGGIYVVGAGSHPVSSESELMGRELERVFYSLRAKADITVACVPPILPSGAVNPVLRYVDGVLLCMNRTAGRREDIRSDFSKLWQADIPVIGLVGQELPEVEERETLVLGADASEVEVIGASTDGDASEADKWTALIEKSLPPEPTDGRAQADRAQAEAQADRAQAEAPVTGAGGPALDEHAETLELVAEPESVETREAEPAETGDAAAEGEAHETSSREESLLVDTALFGQKRRRMLPFVIGLGAVAVTIGALALSGVRLVERGKQAVPDRAMRSIVLPGSDGIMGAGEAVGDSKESVVSASDSARAAVPRKAVPEVARRQTSSSRAVSSVPAQIGEGRVPGEDHGIGDGPIYLHVSSFKTYENARSDSLTLANNGVRSFVVPIDLGARGMWYRVLVGPFEREEDATAAASRIEPLKLAPKVRIFSGGVTD